MNLRDIPTIDGALHALANPHAKIQFSQFGEDVIIESMLDTFSIPRHGGYYVDIGAHHPSYLSNTALFHQLGWTGVNIDANPDSVALFQQARPADRNVLAVVSDEPGEVDFVVFESAAISSADPLSVQQVLAQGRSRVTRHVLLPAQRLSAILAAAVPPDRRIDLMSIDVEGFDLRVLRSNDWERFAPFFLIVEDPDMSFIDRPSTPIFEFLKPLGYRLISQAFISSIYVRDQPPRGDV